VTSHGLERFLESDTRSTRAAEKKTNHKDTKKKHFAARF